MAALLALPLPSRAASFDCARARSKLNRTICSDAELARVDRIVWDTYGERLRTLAPLATLHVRERHLLWRRARGLYEMTVEALLHDYRSHLDWLNHPLLGAEGRYRRYGPVDSGARLEVELDLREAGAAGLRGLVTLPAPVAWQAHVRGAAAADQALRLAPLSPGTGAPLAPDCGFEIRFTGDAAHLEASGACGAAFGGRYVRILHD
ncbi:MAG: hypothetical protein JNM90_22230 [Burkholderiales bacterium]|nr:hypothetical protein [Burkholderiales bacterium]